MTNINHFICPMRTWVGIHRSSVLPWLVVFGMAALWMKMQKKWGPVSQKELAWSTWWSLPLQGLMGRADQDPNFTFLIILKPLLGNAIWWVLQIKILGYDANQFTNKHFFSNWSSYFSMTRKDTTLVYVKLALPCL